MKSINPLLHRLLKKSWSEQDIQNMIGAYREAFTAYAINDRIRFGGASGGVTSAILVSALESGLTDGAVVCRTRITDDHRVRTEFFIAKNQEELLLSQDSKYVQTKFVPEALSLIEGFDGKLAVVGLPCDLTLLKKKIQRVPQLGAKVQFTIGLFCGHSSQHQLIDNVARKLRPQENSRLDHFRFRIGLWRGYSLASFDDHIIVENKSSYFTLYQNLYFFCQKKCLYCHDHFAYNADISVGDIWSYNQKNKNIKFNCIINKSEVGSKVISAAHEDGYIFLENAKIEEIIDGQSRGAPTHNNTSAKSMAAKKLGMTIPDMHNKKVKWHEYLVALLILFNFKWSMNDKYSWLIFKIPRKILRAYLFFLKGLESIK